MQLKTSPQSQLYLEIRYYSLKRLENKSYERPVFNRHLIKPRYFCILTALYQISQHAWNFNSICFC
jgi:hypothetical protein